MRLRRIVLPAVVGVVLLGGLTAVQDTVFRERIEDKLTDSAAAALFEAGLDDVDVTFTGRDGEVTAATEAAAVEAGALVADVEGVRVVRAFGPDGALARDEDSGETGDSEDAGQTDESAEPAPAEETAPAPTAEEREEAQAALDELQAVGFEHNSDVLTADGVAVVDDVAAALTEHSAVTVRIEGHADVTGMLAHTQDLSERRAQRVLDRLVELGIGADRLSSVGYGETRPVVAGTSDARNRRVEFAVTN